MSEWQAFFDNHAPDYMENVFTQNTEREVDFLLEVFQLPPGSTILDMGCGTGRHAIELARRGYRVTGVDLSAGMLQRAREAAQQAGVDVTFVQADATAYRADTPFDAAICLCEGAFGLLGAADDAIQHDLQILQNIHASIKPGAPFMLTALLAFRHIRNLTQSEVDAGAFNLVEMTEVSEIEWEGEAGDTQSVTVRERSYTPSELRLLMQVAGFAVQHIWSGTAGGWQKRPPQLDEMELMVIAEKPA